MCDCHLWVVTNILKGKSSVFYQTDHSLATIIRASVSFPGIYPPVKIDDDYYVDGGVYQNLPSLPLRDYGATDVIGVDVIPDIKLSNMPNNAALIVDRSLDLMLVNQQKNSVPPDILIRPVNVPMSSFDIKSYDALIEYGYQSVIQNKSKFDQFMV